MGFSFLQVAKKRRRRSETHDDVSIPTDLVTEILTKLPAKSLMRFKCVSKLWSSLIRSEYFSNRFLTKVPSQQRLYLCLSDVDDYRNSVILSLSNTPSPWSSSFVVNHDLTIPMRGGQILHNLCGFMCYTFSRRLRIYNPTTRQFLTLPARSICFGLEECKVYYFGHDPVNNEYKVICSTGIAFRSTTSIRSEQWVCVLKPGASWRKAAAPASADFCPHVPIRRGLSINGVIYYLAWVGTCNYAVVSFHIRSEEFKMIKIPSKFEDGRMAKVSLIEYGGKVTVFNHTHLEDEGVVDLWVMEDAGNKEWSKKTLVVQPSQLHLVNNTSLGVKGTSQSGKVLLIPHVSRCYILCYDLQSNDIKKIDIKGIPTHWFIKARVCFDLMFMDQSESIMCLET